MKAKIPFTNQLSNLAFVFKGCGKKVIAGCIATIVCGVAGVALMLLTVTATKNIVAAACDGWHDGLVTWGVALCILMLSRLIITRLGQWVEAKCIVRFSYNLRSRLFSRIINGTFNADNELHSASVVSCLSTDVGAVSTQVCSTFPAIAVSAISLIAAFAYLFHLAPVLAVAVTALMPVMIAIGKIPIKRTHKLTAAIREAETAINRRIQDYASHRIMLLTLGYSDSATDDLKAAQSNFYKLTLRRNYLGILAGGAVTFGFMAGYAAMFLYCAFGLIDGDVSFAVMTALLQLTAMVQQPVVSLSHKITPIVNASVAARRLRSLNDSYSGCIKRDTTACIASCDIRFDHVFYRYGKDKGYVLSDFCDTIPCGKVTVVMGKTGIGKTTLLRMMLGLCSPEKGHFYSPFLNADFKDIVYIPQGNTLMSGTVMSNLLMGKPNAKESEIRVALHMACADFVWSLAEGLHTRCGENGYGFSEGQAQRICIARGLLRLSALRQTKKDGIMLLLDEPTSSLDSDTETEMLARLFSHVKGLTIVAVSHKTALQQFADKIIALNKRIHS